MKTLKSGVHSKYYKVRYIKISGNNELFIKEVKRHWWSCWKLIKSLDENKVNSVVVYINDPYIGMRPLYRNIKID